jgi:hypothetical protein
MDVPWALRLRLRSSYQRGGRHGAETPYRFAVSVPSRERRGVLSEDSFRKDTIFATTNTVLAG